MIRSDGTVCSFCERPRKFALRVYSTAEVSICDRCLNDAANENDIPPQNAHLKCSFCEDEPSGTALKIKTENAAICTSCTGKLLDRMEDELESAANEFVKGTDMPEVGENEVKELMGGVGEIISELNRLTAEFEQGNINWDIYNMLELNLGKFKGLASRLGLHDIADLMWKIVTSLSRIQFDDLVLNKPAFDKLCELGNELEELMKGNKASNKKEGNNKPDQ